MTATATTPANNHDLKTPIWYGALRAKLRQDAQDYPFHHPCHLGPVAYHLSLAGHLLDQVFGRAVCICGKHIGNLTSTMNGSHMTLTRACL